MEVCRNWGSTDQSLLVSCSIMFKNKADWFCGSSLCFYLQLLSRFLIILVLVVHHHPKATKIHLQSQKLGCL